MNISGINNVSFGGRMTLYGTPMSDWRGIYGKRFDKRGDSGVQVGFGTVSIDTDCIDEISKEHIHVYDRKNNKGCTIEIKPKSLSLEQLLAAYTAACQNPNVTIDTTK